MNWRDRISINPRIHHGKPCIQGTRVPVSVIVGSIADGDTPERIIEAWPQLSDDDIKAALKFALEPRNQGMFEDILSVDGPATSRQFASLYQITAAIKHFHKTEFECTITLAAAGEGILPDPQDKFFQDKYLLHWLRNNPSRQNRKLDLNFIQNWLKHGKYDGQEVESMQITEFMAVVALQRAITKFVAVYRKESRDMTKFMEWSRNAGYPTPTKRKRTRPQLRVVDLYPANAE